MNLEENKNANIQIKVKENTILSFDEGKKNLLNWVNTNFK